MAIKLTLILVAVIFLAMRFGGGPIPEQVARQDAEPRTDTLRQDTRTETDQAAETPRDDDLPPAEPLTSRDNATASATDATGQDEQASSIDSAVASALSESAEDTDPQDTVLPGLSLNGLRLADDGAAALSLADTVRQRRETADAEIDPLARPTLGSQTETLTLPDQTNNPSPETQALLDAPAPEPAGNALPTARITGTSVNMRAGPSTAEPVVGQVGLDVRVEVIGDATPGWTIIRHPERGDTVYISSRFLDRSGN